MAAQALGYGWPDSYDTLEVCILNLRRKGRPRLLGRLTPLPKETWALVTQLLEARAGRRGVDGRGNFAASKRRSQAKAAVI